MNILLADDDPDDLHLAAEAFQEIDPSILLDSVCDGQELLRDLHLRARQDTLPQLVLLDLNMPRKSGLQALVELRRSEQLRHLPVVVLTTSRSSAEILECHRQGANAFMSKPDSFQALVEQLRLLVRYWFGTCQLPRLAS